MGLRRDRGKPGAAASRLVWAALGCIVTAEVAGKALWVWTGLGVDWSGLLMLPFPIVGALVASRQPRNAVGWVLLGIGGVSALGTMLTSYASLGLTSRPWLPGADVALVVSLCLWVPFFGLIGTFLILLFPDGRLPSSRWRPLAWCSAIVLALSFIAIMVTPGSLADEGFPAVRNPLGIDAMASATVVTTVLIALIPICIVGCAAGLIQRFRRARGQERLQLKWLATAAGFAAVVYLVIMAVNLPFIFSDRPVPRWIDILRVIGPLAFVLIPLAVGVAILRHRLYDIDVIINRTLVYGSLTAALTVTYVLLVTVLQTVSRPLTGQSDLAVAVSTLVVAALFRPGRVRIQAFIDRHFYRRRYDAVRTLATFASRLRDDVDLDALSDELVATARKVMEPAHASLWMLPHGHPERLIRAH